MYVCMYVFVYTCKCVSCFPNKRSWCARPGVVEDSIWYARPKSVRRNSPPWPPVASRGLPLCCFLGRNATTP